MQINIKFDPSAVGFAEWMRYLREHDSIASDTGLRKLYPNGFGESPVMEMLEVAADVAQAVITEAAIVAYHAGLGATVVSPVTLFLFDPEDQPVELYANTSEVTYPIYKNRVALAAEKAPRELQIVFGLPDGESPGVDGRLIALPKSRLEELKLWIAEQHLPEPVPLRTRGEQGEGHGEGHGEQHGPRGGAAAADLAVLLLKAPPTEPVVQALTRLIAAAQ